MIFKINKREILYFIGFILQFIYTFYKITLQVVPYSEIYVLLILLFLGFSMLLNRYSKYEMKILVFIFAILLLNYLIMEDAVLFRIFFLIVGAKNIDYKKIQKVLVILYSAMFFGVVIASLFFGFGNVSQQLIWRSMVGYQTRYMLGFDGPNRLMVVWLCWLSSVILFNNNQSLFRRIVFTLITIFLYHITDSRTGLIGSVFLLIIPCLSDFFQKKFWKLIIEWIGIVEITFVFLLTAISCIKDIGKSKLGMVLNGRTQSLYKIFMLHKPSLFGNHFTDGYYGLDNSYFLSLYKLGIVFMIIYIFILLKLFFIIAKKKAWYDLACLVSFVAMAYVIEMIYVPFINYIFFLVIKYWSDIIANTRKVYEYS